MPQNHSATPDMTAKELAELPVEELVQEVLAARARAAELDGSSSATGLAFRRVSELSNEAVRKIEEGLTPILTPVPELSIKREGQPRISLIEGENLAVLTALQATHQGKVDVIYIDPPYNTGNGGFLYEDSRFCVPDKTSRALLDRHSAWLSFMERRLLLARELLSETGFIAISVDENEYHRLHLLMDGIFGEDNVKTAVVKMSEAAGVKMRSVRAAGGLAKLKEYVVFAGNGRRPFLPVEDVPKATWDVAYNLYAQGYTKEMHAAYLALKKGPTTAEQIAEFETKIAGVTLTSARMAAASAGVTALEFPKWRRENAWRIWSTTNGGGSVKKALAARAEAGSLPEQEIVMATTPRGAIYMARSKNSRTVLVATDYLGIHPGDLWTDITTTGLAKEGGVDFKNGKKPLKLLRRIIGMAPKDAVVLDFFAGSGSTGHAVAELNSQDSGTRSCILVTNNEGNIAREIAQKRMARVLTGNGWPDGKARKALPGELTYAVLEFAPRISEDSPLIEE